MDKKTLICQNCTIAFWASIWSKADSAVITTTEEVSANVFWFTSGQPDDLMAIERATLVSRYNKQYHDWCTYCRAWGSCVRGNSIKVHIGVIRCNLDRL